MSALRLHGPHRGVHQRAGRGRVALNAAAYGVGKTEIAQAIQEAQDALGWSDAGLASKAGVTIKMLRHLKRPLCRDAGNVRAPGRNKAVPSLTWNRHAQRALEKIMAAFEAKA